MTAPIPALDAQILAAYQAAGSALGAARALEQSYPAVLARLRALGVELRRGRRPERQPEDGRPCRGRRRAEALDRCVSDPEAIALAERCGISRAKAKRRLRDFANGKITAEQRDVVNPRLGSVLRYRRETLLALLRSAGGSQAALAVYLGVSRQAVFDALSRLGLVGVVPRDRTVAPRCEVCCKEYVPDPQPGKRRQKFCRAPACREEARRRRFDAWYADPANRARHAKAASERKHSPRAQAVLDLLATGARTSREIAVAMFESERHAGPATRLLLRLEREGLARRDGERWARTAPEDSR